MASGDGRSEWVECKKRDGSHECELCGNDSGWCSFDRHDANVAHCQKHHGEAVPGWDLVKISEHGGGAVYRRSGTQRERLDPATERARRDAEAAERAARDAEKIAFARKVAAKARGTSDHPRLRAYFASRGVDLASLPGGIVPRAVRFSASQPFKYTPKSGNDVDLAPGPAALCMTLDEHDQHVGMQRIYLDPDGDGKRPRGMCLPAGVDDPKGGDPKKTLGVVAASACRLGGCQSPHAAQDAAERGRVVLLACEGIETGVAILAAVNAWAATIAAEHPLAGVRFEVWACVSTSGLRSIRLRAATVARGGYAAVLVMADHDRYKPNEKHRPGASAAVMAVQKITKEYGVPAAVVLPTMADAPELVGPAPSAVDGYGEILSDEKSVDWLDVYNLAGGWSRVAARVINVAGSLVGNAKDAQGSATERNGMQGGRGRINQDGVKESARRADLPGGGDGGAPLEGEVLWDGKSPIEILPSNRVRRARLALARLFAPGSFEGGAKSAAGERFTLCYHVPTQTWLRYNGLRYVKVTNEVLRSHLVRFFHPFWVWSSEGLKARARRMQEVVRQESNREKKQAANDGLDGDAAAETTPVGAGTVKPGTWRWMGGSYDVEMKIAAAPLSGDVRRSDLSSSAIDDIICAMQVEASVHHVMLPVWAPATFDGDGRPVWGTAAWPDESVDREDPENRPLFTAYRNGVIDVGALRDGKVRRLEHSPRFISPNCLPYELPFDAVADVLRRDPGLDNMGWSLIDEHAPNFAAFIKKNANGDLLWESELQKVVGLVQANDTRFECIPDFVGAIGSGKSTLARLMVAVVGNESVATMSLKDLTERFNRAALIGKKLVYIDEARMGHTSDPVEVNRMLLTLSSGVAFHADMKNKEAQESVYSSAIVLLTGNDMPRFPDGAAALSRRLVVFTFPDGENQRKRRGEEGDRNLLTKMRAEVPWIAAWGLIGMVRLYREGRFIQPRDSHEFIEEYKRRSSQGYAFFEDCLLDAPGSCVAVKMLYAIYKGHARARGVGILGEEEFGSQIRTNFPGLRKSKVTDPASGKRVYCYHGLRPRCVGDPESVGPKENFPVRKLLGRLDAAEVAEFEFEWREDEWATSDGQQHLQTA